MITVHRHSESGNANISCMWEREREIICDRVWFQLVKRTASAAWVVMRRGKRKSWKTITPHTHCPVHCRHDQYTACVGMSMHSSHLVSDGVTVSMLMKGESDYTWLKVKRGRHSLSAISKSPWSAGGGEGETSQRAQVKACTRGSGERERVMDAQWRESMNRKTEGETSNELSVKESVFL